MYDYKARTYSPTLGRFLQTDPIGYGDGMNWYNYTHSDPVNGTDPSGTVCGDDNDPCGPDITINAGIYCGLSCTSYSLGDFVQHYGPNFNSGIAGDIPESTVTAPVNCNLHRGSDARCGPLTSTQPLTVIYTLGDFLGGQQPQNPQPKPTDACGQVAQESGPVTTFGLTGTAVVGGGVTGSVGHFHNGKTGSYGEFYSVGGGGGVDIAGGLFAGHYDNIQTLAGFSVNANGTFGTVSLTATLTASTPLTNGTAAAGAPGAGGSVTASYTRLFNCHVGH